MLKEPGNTSDQDKPYSLWRELIKAGLAKQCDDNIVNTKTHAIKRGGGVTINLMIHI